RHGRPLHGAQRPVHFRLGSERGRGGKDGGNEEEGSHGVRGGVASGGHCDNRSGPGNPAGGDEFFRWGTEEAARAGRMGSHANPSTGAIMIPPSGMAVPRPRRTGVQSFIAVVTFCLLLPQSASAASRKLSPGQILEISEDLVLSGDDVLEVNGTAEK